MTKNTTTWGISFPEGTQNVAVPTDVEGTAKTTDVAISGAQAKTTETVMAQVDTEIADATKNVVYRTDPEVARQRDDDDIAYTVAFADGKRTWIESNPDGYPTTWARNVLIDTLEPYWGGGSGGGGGNLSGGVGGDIVSMWTGNDYPRARVASDPLFTLADTGMQSMSYGHVFYDAAGELWMCFSTDHAPQWTQSGTYIVKFVDGPLNGVDMTTFQRTYLSTNVGGGQHETPRIEYNPSLGLYQQTYSKGGGRGTQSTFAATAPAVTGPWTDHGAVAQMASREIPDNGHTGYLYPYRIGGRWYGTSRYGAYTWGLWHGANDWLTWRADPRRTTRGVDVMETFDWYIPTTDDSGASQRFQPANQPFRWNGRLWNTATISSGGGYNPETGEMEPSVVVARISFPISEDLLQPAGLPIVYPEGEEPGNPRFTWGGAAYSLARVGAVADPAAYWVIKEVY